MLEIRTLTVSFSVTMILQTFAIGVLWIQNHKLYNGINYWVLSYLLSSTGLLLIIFQNILPDLVSIVLANIFTFFGVILLYNGLEHFTGKRSSQIHNYVLLTIFVVIHIYFTFEQPSIKGRVLNQSIASGIVWLESAWLMLRRVSADQIKATKLVGIICILLFMNALGRVVLNLTYHQGEILFKSGVWNFWSYLASQTLLVALTLSLLLMISRRLNGELEADINKRKQVEEQINANLKEKETLLHEIHHRVKNNLAVVASLLKLQASNMNDERLTAALMDSQNRVQSMSDIHEVLYKSENLSALDMDFYITKLARDVAQNYTLGSKVNIKINAELILIGSRQATPVGLIINELITNSFKYAFPDNQNGDINISLHRNDDQIVMQYFDNGIGIPEDFGWKSTKSMGLNLVKILSENQLGGTINLDNTNGTKFTIKFNLDLDYQS